VVEEEVVGPLLAAPKQELLAAQVVVATVLLGVFPEGLVIPHQHLLHKETAVEMV
jgi:hypothetical protein